MGLYINALCTFLYKNYIFQRNLQILNTQIAFQNGSVVSRMKSRHLLVADRHLQEVLDPSVTSAHCPWLLLVVGRRLCTHWALCCLTPLHLLFPLKENLLCLLFCELSLILRLGWTLQRSIPVYRLYLFPLSCLPVYSLFVPTTLSDSFGAAFWFADYIPNYIGDPGRTETFGFFVCLSLWP